MRHIIPISGKDSLATAIVQAKREPEKDYEFIYNDTAMELPETYAWLDDVEHRLQKKIIRIGKSLRDVIYEQGILPSPRMRFCTKYSKIFPMKDYVGKQEATLYIGLRADEDRAGFQPTKGMSVRYPLQECGMKLKDVYTVVEHFGLMPPNFFWQRVYDAVMVEIGNLGALVKEMPRMIFDRAFAWRSRPNCFMCFYQRRYEWVGLLEHHPDLFAQAEFMENDKNLGDRNLDGKQGQEPYYWIAKDMPLARIREHSDVIVKSRVDALSTMIRNRAQTLLFTDAMLDELDMAQKSCGLFCGK